MINGLDILLICTYMLTVIILRGRIKKYKKDSIIWEETAKDLQKIYNNKKGVI